MSYTPTNWKAGDIVTSAKLNKMEQGIAAGGGIKIVHLTEEDASSENDSNLLKATIPDEPAEPIIKLDITPNELMDAFENGEIVIIMELHSGLSGFQSLISDFYYDGTMYVVRASNLSPFTSSDPNEYFIQDPNSDV